MRHGIMIQFAHEPPDDDDVEPPPHHARISEPGDDLGDIDVRIRRAAAELRCLKALKAGDEKGAQDARKDWLRCEQQLDKRSRGTKDDGDEEGDNE
jgi:hypothetical protein